MNVIIGIDGGGTKTVGIAAARTGQIRTRVEVGASNYHTVGETQTKKVLGDLVSQLLVQAKVSLEHCIGSCLGMAGLGCRADREIIGRICGEIGFRKNCILTHDAQIALVSGTGKLEGVIIVAGTGSIVYGINADGMEARSGGWGHVLGDEGSGYGIAVSGLRAIARSADGRGARTQLTELMLNEIGLQQPGDLIRWAHSASKDRVSALANLIFVAMDSGDTVARRIIQHAADELVLAAQAVITELGPDQPADIIFSGGILTHQPGFVNLLCERLQPIVPNARVGLAKHEPVYGAVLLAMSQLPPVAPG